MAVVYVFSRSAWQPAVDIYQTDVGLVLVAEVHGCRPDQLRVAWDAALAADRPTILDVYTDPDVPPLPPHISFKQARAYAESILKGDPDSAGMLRASVKELFA